MSLLGEGHVLIWTVALEENTLVRERERDFKGTETAKMLDKTDDRGSD